MNLSSEAFANCDRQFVRVMDYDVQYKKRMGAFADAVEDAQFKVQAKECMRKMFEHDLVHDIPRQLEKFFEVQ